MDDDIYEDYEQTNKSTGSGLVLAVPAMVLETSSSNMIDPSKPMEHNRKRVEVRADGEATVSAVLHRPHPRDALELRVCRPVSAGVGGHPRVVRAEADGVFDGAARPGGGLRPKLC